MVNEDRLRAIEDLSLITDVPGERTTRARPQLVYGPYKRPRFRSINHTLRISLANSLALRNEGRRVNKASSRTQAFFFFFQRGKPVTTLFALPCNNYYLTSRVTGPRYSFGDKNNVYRWKKVRASGDSRET